MTVYVFGNQDSDLDNRVYKAVKKFPGMADYVMVKPNEDLPFAGKKRAVILDTIQGIGKVTLFNQTSLDKLMVSRGTSAHDYDLGFQLKYLRKLGKIKEVLIIGIPQEGRVDYLRIQSILRKLVAQDMHGS